MTHKLKVWPTFFRAIVSGEKTFEFRTCGDRVFSVGDTLILEEWHPGREEYTGQWAFRVVTYALYLDHHGNFITYDGGTAKNIAAACIMSIK